MVKLEIIGRYERSVVGASPAGETKHFALVIYWYYAPLVGVTMQFDSAPGHHNQVKRLQDQVIIRKL